MKVINGNPAELKETGSEGGSTFVLDCAIVSREEPIAGYHDVL